MKIFFTSDFFEGGNVASLYNEFVEYKTKNKKSIDCEYRGVVGSTIKWKPYIYDIGITSNTRCLRQTKGIHNKKSLTVNVHHGCGYLGDFGPEEAIDIHLAVSDAKKEIFVKNGCRPQDVFVVGQPRLDYIFKNNLNNPRVNELYRTNYLLKNNLDPVNTTVMYAPTWDRAPFGAGTKGFYPNWCDEEEKVSQALADFFQYSNINLIIRLHGHYSKKFEKGMPDELYKIFSPFAHISSMRTEPDSFPAMVASDILITDFSSISTDFLALDRPIIFIEPWKNWVYNADTRWYCTKEERPGLIVNTVDELMNGIADELFNPERFTEQRKKIADKMIQFFDGRSSERAAEAIINEYRRRFP